MKIMAGAAIRRPFNTYDLLKCLAVLSMILDHISVYFFPEALWWRVWGRAAFPLFLFLVGFSEKTSNDRAIYIGCAMLIVADIVAMRPILPLNILFTIIVIRLAMGWVQPKLQQPRFAREILIASFILYLPTYALFEYGTLGLLFAISGYTSGRKYTHGSFH